ncbi:MAG: hypothetical protein ACR2MA_09425 [Egibacteraceae bacterium]
MTARSEYDAAYFTLLRAREEYDHLLRYREYLEAEAGRLAVFSEQTRDLAEPIPRKMRRPIDATTKTLLEAVGRRRSAVLAELGRQDNRVDAAQAFVEECEAELAQLRP